MSYREKIEWQLTGVQPALCAAFAARAALRVLPLLAAKENDGEPFWYWKNSGKSRNLLDLIVAARGGIDFAVLGSEARISGVTVAASDAFAAEAAGGDAAFAVVAAAYAADDTTGYAAAYTADDTTRYDADAATCTAACTADAAAYAATDGADAWADTEADISSDLQCLKNLTDVGAFVRRPLWSQGLPDHMQIYWKRLVEWAKALDAGFEVWLDWYQERLDGREIDRELLEKQVYIPAEIWHQDVVAVNAYLATLSGAKKAKRTLQKLNLVRAIFMGNGAAGKTSLIRVLSGLPVIEGQEKMTPGIEIREWPVGDTEITAHFWDFGGQVMAHSTHQFFLRERCLYVLVLDARAEINANEQAEYWLEHVRAFGKNAPVMLVGNKSDLAQVNLNMGTLREKYPNIVDFYPLSCTNLEDGFQTRFTTFKTDLIEQLQAVGTHQVYFTDKQFAVLETLRERSPEAAFLAHQEFEAICSKQDITSEGVQNQDWLLDLFDKLGVVIHFPQLARLDSYILNPRWLTYGIYTLLYSDQANQGKGILSEAEVISILGSNKVKDEHGNVLDYPADKCGFVIDAMEEFKLCYRLSSDHKHFVIPDLLPSDQPELDFDKSQAGTLEFEFEFRGFLPRHVMPTFIVSRYDEIKNNKSVWQQGVLLHSGQYDCDALVRVDYHARTLSLSVQGEQVSRYFTVIRDEITAVLQRMSELQYQEWVWLRDEMLRDEEEKILGLREKQDKANFRQLLKMERKGQPVFISESGASYDVAKILRIMPEKFRQNIAKTSNDSKALDKSESVKVFISYAHEDEGHKDELVTRLKGIQREFEQLNWWDDRQIDSGKWERQILGQLEQADITLLLISPDFIASDFCFNKEMKDALVKYEQRGNPVIPIIVRHTEGWNSHAIGQLQALPKDARPIDDWPNSDRFWSDVQKGLTREIEHLLVKAP